MMQENLGSTVFVCLFAKASVVERVMRDVAVTDLRVFPLQSPFFVPAVLYGVGQGLGSILTKLQPHVG